MRQKRYLIPAVTAAMMLVVAACGGDDADDDTPPVAEPTEDTTPELTAPPQPTEPTEEELAEEDIQAAFERLVVAWEDTKINTSDYATDESGWAIEVVESWPVYGDAGLEFENWISVWGTVGIEQVGDSDVAFHTVKDVELSDAEQVDLSDDETVSTATSTACLDQRNLELVDYNGDPYDAPSDPAQFQTWRMTWQFHPSFGDDGGWVVVDIALTVDEPCE
ncbi:hypothetical protein [Phytoactinopolyspora mesophila]|uniref:Lipoprotein n=1 Tax=Phytoactinopolyspora mesophila TaxID=2650750 RepID=A0A7K3MA83_9ACTN|nr:hypothetical protein [Phytoactinopolyspora mesophila]NDL60204.1 hypothetical protein [Phytoactinopolyspora mesophila]